MADLAPSERQSVSARTLALLGAFDERHPSLSLTELSKRAGMPLSTAHRLVSELTKWGALARHQKSYVLGRRIAELGFLAPEAWLRRAALSHLLDLQTATRQAVHLAIRHDVNLVYLERLVSSASMPIRNLVGFARPIHTTGTGKVLLAHAPIEIQQEVLRRLFRVTPYTITQPDRLNSELEATRENGYAISSQEMRLGFCSIAVPIIARGSVVGAIGIVVPNLTSELRLAAQLKDVSRSITASL